MHKPRNHHQSGIALVLTLAMLVMITILIVAFTASMRTERQASASMANDVRARLFAQDAVAHAISILDRNIPQPVPPMTDAASLPSPTNWIINPGLLTLIGTGGETDVPLSSNPTSAYTSGPSDPNLNFRALRQNADGTYNFAILGNGQILPNSTSYNSGTTSPPIQAAWINVLKDPSAPASASNPIVGRYAFWMDDENAKINLNTAYGKPASSAMDFTKVNPLQQVSDQTLYGIPSYDPNVPETDNHAAKPDNGSPPTYNTKYVYNNALVDAAPLASITSVQMANTTGSSPKARYFPLWHPSAINLDVLGSSLNRNALADWVYNAKTAENPNYRLLTFPDQVKQFVSTNPETYYQTNKFFLTTSSRDPEFNVFGKSRLFFERNAIPAYAGNSTTPPVPDQPMMFQADYDGSGPTYFHGWEGASMAGTQPNITGVQHVADTISEILNRSDWPGMPATSFVNKWGGGVAGQLEADQVAHNIAVLGNYAPGDAYRNAGSGRDGGWAEGADYTLSDYLSNLDPNNAASTNWPGTVVRKGKLSGKAIVPYYPKPLLNEIVITVTPVPDPSQQPPPFDATQRYQLKVSLQMEFYQPQKVPLVDIKGQFSQDFTLTHFDYTVTGSVNGSGTSASQTANSYTVDTGINKLGGWLGPPEYDTVTGTTEANTCTLAVRPGSYWVVASNPPSPNGANNQTIYVANGGSLISSGSSTNPKPSVFSGIIHMSGNMRVVVSTHATGGFSGVQQLIPVWDSQDGSAALTPPSTAVAPSGGTADRVHFAFDIDLATLGPTGVAITRSLEIADARLGGLASQWVSVAASAESPANDSLHAINQVTTSALSNVDISKQAFVDSLNYFYNESPRASIGMLSTVPTGMQRGIVGSTLTFQPSTNTTILPDWLLLDLLAPTIYPHTYINSTMGKVNINANIYPNFGIQRWAPLQAVFQNMPNVGTANAPSLNVNDASTVVQNILNHKLSGVDFGAQNRYDYVGELCEVAGVADSGTSNWDKEILIRNLANVLTTKSNTFCVWGEAQAIKVQKQSGNTNYGAVQSGDTVTILGDKKFQSIIERYVWPGRDGVPGNGHTSISGTNSVGSYDSLAAPASTKGPIPPQPWDMPMLPGSDTTAISAGAKWAVIDGPDSPTYTPKAGTGTWAQIQDQTNAATPIESADNPLRALMKYRVVNFNYLNDY